MEELKLLLENPFDKLEENDLNGFQDKCKDIAEKLFCNYCINCDEKEYYFAEIEFYYYDKSRFNKLWNTCTYPRSNKKAGVFFLHDSGVDICFNSDFSEGIFGGILIRSLLQISENGKGKYITGPFVCAKEIFNACPDINNGPKIKRIPYRKCAIDVAERYNIPNEPENLNLCFFDKSLKDNLKNTFENESWDFDKRETKCVTRYYSKRFFKVLTDNLTNTVYFSSLLPEKCPILNTHLVDALQKHGVQYAYLFGTKDIWCRDFMPIQIDENHFVFYKYTPDYLQDEIGLRIQTNPEDVFQTESNNLRHLLPQSSTIDLVLDGGNVVKCGNKIVMTDKVFVENKDKSHSKVRQLLEEAFRCEIVFLPWDEHEDYGHCDGIIHYLDDNRVMMTNYDDFDKTFAQDFLRILEKHFDVITLKYNVKRKHERSWSYINFLQVGNLILVPQLGITEDEQALEQIRKALPNCKVAGIPALEAVRRGGALNCISWNIKA
ncbi:MAG: agmatine deiminase family protein [Bacteroidales bacterium]|nr:agmatine deiminase family protein [Bacteroidales bacterium]